MHTCVAASVPVRNCRLRDRRECWSAIAGHHTSEAPGCPQSPSRPLGAKAAIPETAVQASAVHTLDITVLGAGILGIWQALTLARRGHRVRLLEASAAPFTAAASRYAGAMLAPYCEAEGAEPIVTELGLEALALWRATYPQLSIQGSLVVAGARDRPELLRFARMTRGHATLDAEALGQLEPDLAGRFQTGLHYPQEAHMAPAAAMTFLLEAARQAGAKVQFGVHGGSDAIAGSIVDCRGLAARDALPTLRGVRGERVLIRSRDVRLMRPVRLLHPRHPLYVVPWADDIYMVGATVIESEDPSPMTLRSALELLGLAYALHPGLGEAEVIEFGAGLRPAFPDNVPKVVPQGTRIHVNGAYRHGFLLSPKLAEIAADYLETGTRYPGIVVDG